MSEVITESIAEQDLPVEDFISRANLRDAGKEVPDLPLLDKKTADDIEPAEPAKAAKADEKIDKRTREGRKLSIQQEIDQLTTQKHDTQREYEQAQTQLAQLRADVADLEAKKSPPAKVEDKKADVAETAAWQRYRTMPNAPKVADFEAYEDYLDARSDFIATERFKELHQQDVFERQERTRFDAWWTRLQKAKAADPTIDTRLTKDTPSNAQMRDFIIDSDNGVELALYFADHKSDAQRLSTLHPLKLAEELGKLSMKLDAAHSGPAQLPAVSQAKPPIKPVDGSPNVSDEVDEGDLSPEEFIRRGNKRDGIAMPSASHR